MENHSDARVTAIATRHVRGLSKIRLSSLISGKTWKKIHHHIWTDDESISSVLHVN
jgi:hypothetical protein